MADDELEKAWEELKKRAKHPEKKEKTENKEEDIEEIVGETKEENPEEPEKQEENFVSILPEKTSSLEFGEPKNLEEIAEPAETGRQGRKEEEKAYFSGSYSKKRKRL